MEERIAGVAHNAPLPAGLIQRVPLNEKLILAFVLAFLESSNLPAQLLVNGGYVRDLLLGKRPDDLDVSLCLRDCAEHVNIETVMGGLGDFAEARPDLAISNVQITTILSDTAKNKNVDTAKAFMTVHSSGGGTERIEVDFMPTIGVETYDELDRVPLRDVRGTPEEDALRRDLTIGAMLLHVTRGGNADTGASSPRTRAEAEAARLEWRLLDFYGGLDDLRAGVLRAPFPQSRPLTDVFDEVLRTSDELALAEELSIRRAGVPPPPPAPTAGTSPSPDALAGAPQALGLPGLPAVSSAPVAQAVRLPGGVSTTAVLHNERYGVGPDDD